MEFDLIKGFPEDMEQEQYYIKDEEQMKLLVRDSNQLKNQVARKEIQVDEELQYLDDSMELGPED